jgi:hypothetical protein
VLANRAEPPADVPLSAGVGAAETQPLPQAEPLERQRVAEVVSMALGQLERLQGLTAASEARRADLDGAAYEIAQRREKVLQDLRELDAEPATQRGAIRTELARDLAALRASLDTSYRLAPPPSEGVRAQ